MRHYYKRQYITLLKYVKWIINLMYDVISPIISLPDVMSYDNATYGLYTNSLFNPFLGNGDFFHLLITFTNSFDPDQD